MPLLKYVGTKVDGEQAYKEKTGIVWMPGKSHTVSVEHAELLCKHPDVWELSDPQAEAKKAHQAAADAIAAAEAAQKLADEAAAAESMEPAGPTLADADAAVDIVVELGEMNDEALRAWAAKRGIKPHHKKTGEALLAAVRAELAKA